MKNYISILLLLIVSCVNTKESITNEELSILLDKNASEYFETKNKKHLLSSYKNLKKNKDFIEKGLTEKNTQLIISLFLDLKKYDELEVLLNNNYTLKKYYKTSTINLVKFLKTNEKDKNKANSYIYENLKTIKDSLNKTPKDSALYTDYFLMRLYLKGKKEALKEVDSMQIVNKTFTNDFYDLILRDFIKDYPNENLPNK